MFARLLLPALSLYLPVQATATELPRPAEVAAAIDRLLHNRFKADNIQPAARADDTEFLRRAYLDLSGRIPRPAEVHDFLSARESNRRAELIEHLLRQPRFAQHLATVWRAELLPEAMSEPQAAPFRVGFEAWLTDRFRAGIRYDQLVRELLTVPITTNPSGEPVLRDPTRANPLAFFAAKNARPENLAAAVGRSFLGIRLECAQCHDHPFAQWSEDQFWSQAAFFAGLNQPGGLFSPLMEVVDRRELTPPNRRKPRPAQFLDNTRPTWKPGLSSRVALADWITAPENPYFARATANRVWAHFFGTGLVDPVDDFREDNPPSDAELLELLASAFTRSGFDLTFLIRAICLSEAYQRTSALSHPSQVTTRLPARMPVKALTGEQFFDSLALATGYREEQDRGLARRQFLTRFALVGSIGEPETSVQQALTLLNGRFINWATDPQRNPTLIAVTQTPGLTLQQRVETLYWICLGRQPTEEELQRHLSHIRKAAPDRQAERLADIFWVLLNSVEFRLNH